MVRVSPLVFFFRRQERWLHVGNRLKNRRKSPQLESNRHPRWSHALQAQRSCRFSYLSRKYWTITESHNYKHCHLPSKGWYLKVIPSVDSFHVSARTLNSWLTFHKNFTFHYIMNSPIRIILPNHFPQALATKVKIPHSKKMDCPKISYFSSNNYCTDFRTSGFSFE